MLSNEVNFSVPVHIYKIHIFDGAFPLNYQNLYDHQTFQDGDMLPGAV